MTAGKLAANKPAAATNTTLYRCPIDKAASAVLEVCNQSATATSYTAAIRDYDQILTLNSAYSLTVGNIISKYLLTISPGLPTTDFVPGDIVTLKNKQGTFKIQDVYQPTATITVPVKVESLGTVSVDTTTAAGTINVGDTLTGGTSGFVGYVYRIATNSYWMRIPGVTTSGTSYYVNNIGTTTTIAANDYIYFDGEVVRVSARTNYQVTITRAQLGTTAAAHAPGKGFVAFRASATTTTVNEGAVFSNSDTTLTVASATNFTTGSYIKIDNEFLLINSINGNNLSVTRAQLGSTAATHADGSVVTLQTTVTTGQFQFFVLTETVSNGSGGSINLNVAATGGDAYTQYPYFTYNITSTYYEYPSTINFDANRKVRFTQVDTSNATHPLRLSLQSDGTNSPGGTNLTTGVTVSGTPGSAGAYTEVDLSLSNVGSNSTYYIYDSSTANYGTSITIDLTPNYTQIYIYDTTKSKITTSDTFAISSVNYTITGVTVGPYAYVKSIPYAGVSSIATTAATGSAGTATLTFAAQSTAPYAVGQTITVAGVTPTGYNGTYVVTACTTTTVSYANATTAAQTVAGTIVGNTTAKVALGTGSTSFAASDTFYDSPTTPGDVRLLATVGSLSVINAEDYIYYTKAISGNVNDRTPGIVIGPGDNIMINSTANTLSYVLHGFEDSTSDFSAVYYYRTAAQAGTGSVTP